MTAPCIYPTLRYADADAAIAWLTGTVGFKEVDGLAIKQENLALNAWQCMENTRQSGYCLSYARQPIHCRTSRRAAVANAT